jgi:hypothetical protein
LFVGQPPDRRTHVTVGDAERPRELDEAAEGDDAAARRNRVTENRHQQRAAAQWLLTAETCDESVGAADEGVCLRRHKGGD